MLNIPLSALLAKMPVAEIERTIKEFLAPIIHQLSGRFSACRCHSPDPPPTGLVSGAFTPNASATMGFGGGRRLASHACYSTYQPSLAQHYDRSASLRRLAFVRTD